VSWIGGVRDELRIEGWFGRERQIEAFYLVKAEGGNLLVCVGLAWTFLACSISSDMV
jgi:hypothetical protein